jgi:hypothetical protein
MVGFDLNRQWRHPKLTLHPTVFHTKSLVSSFCQIVSLYIDLHGHSRKCGVFTYGTGNTVKHRTFPRLAAFMCREFTLHNCTYGVGRGKRNTGRVVASKDLGIFQTFTVEASFFGTNLVDIPGMGETEENKTREIKTELVPSVHKVKF